MGMRPNGKQSHAALPRVVSADGARALIGCPDRDTAAAVMAEIQGSGGWAAIDRPPEAPMPPIRVPGTPVRDALDPEQRVFV